MKGNVIIQIPGELANAAQNQPVASTEQIKDYQKGKSQEVINQENDSRMDSIESSTSTVSSALATEKTTREQQEALLRAELNAKQLEIGAVQTDEKPTQGSANFVTSGGVFLSTNIDNDYAIPTNNLRNYYINSSGKWYNVNYHHVIIPVETGDIFYIQAPQSYTSIIAWLTSNSAPQNDTIAPLVNGTGLIIIDANTAKWVTAPASTQYMYILMGDTEGTALAGQRKPVVFKTYSSLKKVYEEELSVLPSEIAKTPTTSDTIDNTADLNICDESGNTILSCYDGWIKTKNYDSRKAVVKDLYEPYRRNFFNVETDTTNFLITDFIPTDVNTHETPVYYFDNAVLYLPSSYKATGTPTKLIIYCKEGASTIEQSSDNILTRTKVFRYMLALGYAIMAADGVPNDWKNELHLSERAVGNYVAVQSTIRAFEYVREHYNIDSDRVFIWGYSQGGHYAQNVIENSTIPIAAAAELSPVCSMRYHQWDLNATETIDGISFTKTARLNIARMFGYPTITTNAQLLALEYDPTKTIGYDPWLCNVDNVYEGFVQGTQYGNDLWGLPDGMSLNDILMKKHLRCPLKVWAAENDASLGIDVIKVFVKAIKNAGQIADLQLYTSGGHTIFDYQTAIGTFIENNETQNLIPLAYDVALWYYRFGGYKPLI